MNLKSYLQKKRKGINRKLSDILPRPTKYPYEIHRAMRYSIFPGGKRIRPILAIASCEALGGKEKDVIAYACAIEMIHTYSLIHDDLPAMDNDDTRRGKPACHKAFGEAIAILAGDALLTYSLQTIISANRKNFEKIAICLLNNSSTTGLIGGQVMDILSEGKKISSKTLNYIHKNKTAALISCSAEIGALSAGANLKDVENMRKYGINLGMAFQITDDILDVKGDEKKAGKKLRKDLSAGKNTYPGLHGLEKSIHIAKKYSREAAKIASSYGRKGKILTEIANFISKRTS